MAAIVRCPACTKPVGLLKQDGTLEATCITCLYQIGVVYGELLDCSSQQINTSKKFGQSSAMYKHRYEFRVARPHGQLEVFELFTRQQEELINVRQGDRISLLFTLHNGLLQKVIAVKDHTTGRQYEVHSLKKPLNPSPAFIGIGMGLLVALLLFVPNRDMGRFGKFMTLFLGGTAGTTAYAYSKKRMRSQLPISEEMRLTAEQELLLEKERLDKQITQLRQEQQKSRSLIEQLRALKDKMIEVEQELYTSRIQTIEKGTALLNEQMVQEQNLLDEYIRVVRIIEIEYETSATAAQLPDINIISNRLDELKAMEEKKQELKLQVEANEEVLQLGQ